MAKKKYPSELNTKIVRIYAEDYKVLLDMSKNMGVSMGDVVHYAMDDYSPISCLCGKDMNLFMEGDHARLWSCPPEGCGRVYLEAKGACEIEGTWYTAEQNEQRGGPFG